MLLKEVFERTASFNERVAGARFRSYEWQFLAALDGKATVGEILRRLDLDEAAIAEFIAQQVRSGAIAPRLLSFDEFLGSRNARPAPSSPVDDFRSIVRTTVVAAVAELIVMIGKRRSQGGPPSAPAPRAQVSAPPPPPVIEPEPEPVYYAAEPPQEYVAIVEELESTSWSERAPGYEPAPAAYEVPAAEPVAHEPEVPEPLAYEPLPAPEPLAYEPPRAPEPIAYEPPAEPAPLVYSMSSEPVAEPVAPPAAEEPAEDMTISARLMRDYGPLTIEEAQAAGFTGAALSDYASQAARENGLAAAPEHGIAAAPENGVSAPRTNGSAARHEYEPEATESPDAESPAEPLDPSADPADPIVFSLSARNPDSFWSGKK